MFIEIISISIKALPEVRYHMHTNIIGRAIVLRLKVQEVLWKKFKYPHKCVR